MRMSKVTPQPGGDGSVSLRDYIDAQVQALKEHMRLSHEADMARGLAYWEQAGLIASSVDSRFQAIDKATALAAAAVEKRLESMNEFRAQLNDQASHFVTRSEIEDKIATGRVTQENFEKRMQMVEQNKLNIPAHDGLEKRIQAVELNKANADKMESMQVYFDRQLESQRQAFLLAIEKNQTDIVELRESRSQQSGRTTGMTALWGYFVGAAGVLLSAVGILLIILR